MILRNDEFSTVFILIQEVMYKALGGSHVREFMNAVKHIGGGGDPL